ncbi:MAG TPA: 30S ribosomal protein S5 [Candidatus Nanoarchaeia archaeon]|nr:30S ribosomal protein S5 [Candidatus Nanoarchaeia archaeon]
MVDETAEEKVPAEKVTAEEVEDVEKQIVREVKEKAGFDKTSWKPKTSIGMKVKEGEITDIDTILDQGLKILEAEVVDALLPNMNTELLLIGQSKGKFGGGQRRIFKQTQKKTQEGNKPHFAIYACVGDNNGHIGLGYGKSKETVPAREKALRRAKLSMIKVRRGCGSWQCGCREPHTIPFAVKGKCGSCEIELIPAPKGTGLRVEGECQKVLKLAGIKDIWSQTRGQTRTKINLIAACNEALKNLVKMKAADKYFDELGIVEGAKNEQASSNQG